jgi:hypothetical protein
MSVGFMPDRRDGALLCAWAEELILFVQLQDCLYPALVMRTTDTGAAPGRDNIPRARRFNPSQAKDLTHRRFVVIVADTMKKACAWN